MKYDAIIILGGGLTDKGTLPKWSVKRAELALENYTGKEKIITLSRWTAHKKPILDTDGFPFMEANVMAKYLQKKGVKAGNILIENSSEDTIGNAYFCRFVHTEPGKLRNLLVITSEFHMRRTKLLFDWIFSLKPTNGHRIDYKAAPNIGLRQDEIMARKKREQLSIRSKQQLVRKMKTVGEFHDWLFREHGRYSVKNEIERLTGKTAKSY